VLSAVLEFKCSFFFRGYMADRVLPADADKAQHIKKSSSRYTLTDDHLLCFGYSRPILTCVEREESDKIMSELHERICDRHVRCRDLLIRILRVGYFWPPRRRTI